MKHLWLATTSCWPCVDIGMVIAEYILLVLDLTPLFWYKQCSNDRNGILLIQSLGHLLGKYLINSP